MHSKNAFHLKTFKKQQYIVFYYIQGGSLDLLLPVLGLTRYGVRLASSE